MSANTCVAYYGLKFEISENEIENLETRSDPRIISARIAGLKHYWGNFGGTNERYLLFIGTQIGIMGPENKAEIALSEHKLNEVVKSTNESLLVAGFAEPASLYFQWHEDI